MTSTFDTVAEAERLAGKRLPSAIFSSLQGGRETGFSLRDNRDAFGEISLVPSVFDNPETVDASTTFLGQAISFPAIISPVGALALHPDGELAIARAAARIGTSMSVSSFAGTSVTEVGKVTQNLHFQLYWLGSQSDIRARLERAAAAGAKGLIVTLDLSRTPPRRDWSRPAAIPSKWTLGSVIRHSPAGIRRPAWLLSYLRRLQLPSLRVPNLAGRDGYVPTFVEGLEMMRVATRPTRQDLEWLRGQWHGPLMIKGISTVRDAQIAEGIGADAIGISNHGGNYLDGTVAPIRSLPAIVDALDGRVPLSVDGGVRRGTDVVKAVALGATVAMLGRAVAYGLTVGGEEGVHRTLEIIRSGVVEGLGAIGAHNVTDVRLEHAQFLRANCCVTQQR